MKCAIFEEHSSSCVVYFRLSGTLFPVSMIEGDNCFLVLVSASIYFIYLVDSLFMRIQPPSQQIFHIPGFIQASMSKSQGLFKDFYKSFQQFSRT